MSYQINRSEVAKTAETPRSAASNRMRVNEMQTCSPDSLMALLSALQEIPERKASNKDASENLDEGQITTPLEKLPPGPWCSLGGYFDYSEWPDRQRFLELDKAIAVAQDAPERHAQAEKQVPEPVRETPPAPRERAPEPPAKRLPANQVGLVLDSPEQLLQFIAIHETALLAGRNRAGRSSASLGW